MTTWKTCYALVINNILFDTIVVEQWQKAWFLEGEEGVANVEDDTLS